MGLVQKRRVLGTSFGPAIGADPSFWQKKSPTDNLNCKSSQNFGSTQKWSGKLALLGTNLRFMVREFRLVTLARANMRLWPKMNHFFVMPDPLSPLELFKEILHCALSPSLRNV